VAPPTHSRSDRCRSFGASSQKFAEKTKFQKVLVKRAPPEKKRQEKVPGKKDKKDTDEIASFLENHFKTWDNLNWQLRRKICPDFRGFLVMKF
jgi:hypothetical protein